MFVDRVLPVPEGNWVNRLRRGHYVWLVKERQPVRIMWPWEPEAGCRTGRIGIERCMENSRVGLYAWYIDLAGRGIDGSQLFAPVEDNLPDDPEPLVEPDVRRLERVIAGLSRRVEALELQALSGSVTY